MKFLLLSSILVALLHDGYGYDCYRDNYCDECYEDDRCDYCIEDFGFTQGFTRSCGPCSDITPHCSYCDEECLECGTGYGINGKKQCVSCSSVIPHCVDCFVLFRCSTCQEGYEMSSDRKACNSLCSVNPRPIQHYPDLYRGSIIFVDFSFQCSGFLSGVEFYAERAGTFYFSAWRPSASGDSWTLLGNNTIVSEGEGPQIFTIPSDEQMSVEATDVFGFFYERGVGYRVISSGHIRKRARDGTSSRFVRTRETLEDLSIGVNRSNLAGGGNTERIVPINAIIS